MNPMHPVAAQDAEETEALPIEEHRERILSHIRTHRVTFVQGETGCGKSSMVPQFLYHDNPANRIIVTQPRRLAAVSLANRIAQQMGPQGRRLVGYRLGQGERRETADTRITFCTIGYLLTFLTHDPDALTPFTHLVLDEVHERTIDSDLLLLLTKLLMRLHPTLHICIMSATLQPDVYCDYFVQFHPGLKPLKVGFQRFPNQVFYLDELRHEYPSVGRISHYQQALTAQNPDAENRTAPPSLTPAVRAVLLQLFHEVTRPGLSVLVFLPGLEEIERLMTELRHGPSEVPLMVLPLHSSVPMREQQRVMDPTPPDRCKIVLATNIAESSITIPDMHVVIDTGLKRSLWRDPESGRDTLMCRWISRASAKQRAGRTGRLAPGTVIRLYTEDFYNNDLTEYDEAEMEHACLEKPILTAKLLLGQFGTVQEIMSKLMTPPRKSRIAQALQGLASWGAITTADEHAQVTIVGRLATCVPLELPFVRLLQYGHVCGCLLDAIVLAAGLSIQGDIYMAPRRLYMEDDGRWAQMLSENYQDRTRLDKGYLSDPLSSHEAYLLWLEDKPCSISVGRAKAMDLLVVDLCRALVSSRVLPLSRGTIRDLGFLETLAQPRRRPTCGIQPRRLLHQQDVHVLYFVLAASCAPNFLMADMPPLQAVLDLVKANEMVPERTVMLPGLPRELKNAAQLHRALQYPMVRPSKIKLVPSVAGGELATDALVEFFPHSPEAPEGPFRDSDFAVKLVYQLLLHSRMTLLVPEDAEVPGAENGGLQCSGIRVPNQMRWKVAGVQPDGAVELGCRLNSRSPVACLCDHDFPAQRRWNAPVAVAFGFVGSGTPNVVFASGVTVMPGTFFGNLMMLIHAKTVFRVFLKQVPEAAPDAEADPESPQVPSDPSGPAARPQGPRASQSPLRPGYRISAAVIQHQHKRLRLSFEPQLLSPRQWAAANALRLLITRAMGLRPLPAGKALPALFDLFATSGVPGFGAARASDGRPGGATRRDADPPGPDVSPGAETDPQDPAGPDADAEADAHRGTDLDSDVGSGGSDVGPLTDVGTDSGSEVAAAASDCPGGTDTGSAPSSSSAFTRPDASPPASGSSSPAGAPGGSSGARARWPSHVPEGVLRPRVTRDDSWALDPLVLDPVAHWGEYEPVTQEPDAYLPRYRLGQSFRIEQMRARMKEERRTSKTRRRNLIYGNFRQAMRAALSRHERLWSPHGTPLPEGYPRHQLPRADLCSVPGIGSAKARERRLQLGHLNVRSLLESEPMRSVCRVVDVPDTNGGYIVERAPGFVPIQRPPRPPKPEVLPPRFREIRPEPKNMEYVMFRKIVGRLIKDHPDGIDFPKFTAKEGLKGRWPKRKLWKCRFRKMLDMVFTMPDLVRVEGSKRLGFRVYPADTPPTPLAKLVFVQGGPQEGWKVWDLDQEGIKSGLYPMPEEVQAAAVALGHPAYTGPETYVEPNRYPKAPAVGLLDLSDKEVRKYKPPKFLLERAGLLKADDDGEGQALQDAADSTGPRASEEADVGAALWTLEQCRSYARFRDVVGREMRGVGHGIRGVDLAYIDGLMGPKARKERLALGYRTVWDLLLSMPDLVTLKVDGPDPKRWMVYPPARPPRRVAAPVEQDRAVSVDAPVDPRLLVGLTGVPDRTPVFRPEDQCLADFPVPRFAVCKQENRFIVGTGAVRREFIWSREMVKREIAKFPMGTSLIIFGALSGLGHKKARRLRRGMRCSRLVSFLLAMPDIITVVPDPENTEQYLVYPTPPGTYVKPPVVPPVWEFSHPFPDTVPAEGAPPGPDLHSTEYKPDVEDPHREVWRHGTLEPDCVIKAARGDGQALARVRRVRGLTAGAVPGPVRSVSAAMRIAAAGGVTASDGVRSSRAGFEAAAGPSPSPPGPAPAPETSNGTLSGTGPGAVSGASAGGSAGPLPGTGTRTGTANAPTPPVDPPPPQHGGARDASPAATRAASDGAASAASGSAPGQDRAGASRPVPAAAGDRQPLRCTPDPVPDPGTGPDSAGRAVRYDPHPKPTDVFVMAPSLQATPVGSQPRAPLLPPRALHWPPVRRPPAPSPAPPSASPGGPSVPSPTPEMPPARALGRARDAQGPRRPCQCPCHGGGALAPRPVHSAPRPTPSAAGCVVA